VTRPIRVALVDDHAVVRAGLRSFLESFGDLVVVGEAATGEALLDQAVGWRADVVLVDVLLPGGIDGIETTRRLARAMPDVRVVVLTAFTDDDRLVAALRAGALGFVRKDAAPEALLEAVRAASRGRSNLDMGAMAALLADAADEGLVPEPLTPREVDVLRLMAGGLANREIAEALSIGEETVKTHVASILAKLGADQRTRAVVVALRRGLVALDDVAR